VTEAPRVLPPPATRRDDLVEVIHGVAVPDPYRWLETDDDPAVAEWSSAQDVRTRQALGALASRPRWHERLVALLAEPVSGGCVRRGPWLFTLERGYGREQFVLTVRPLADLNATPRVLVDPSGLAGDAAVALDWFYPSLDGSRVAYGLSEGGDERSTLHVLDVTSGEVLAERIPDTQASSVAWLPGSDRFRYVRYRPGEEYGRRVYEHQLGEAWTDDALVWEALPTPEAWTDVQVSPDGRWTIVSAMIGWSRVDVWRRDEQDGSWATVHEGIDAVTTIRFDGDRFLALTTVDAARGRVVAIDPAAPALDNWAVLVPEGDDVLEGVSPMATGFACWGLRHACARLTHHSPDGAQLSVVALPEGSSLAGLAAARDDDRLVLQVEAFAAPPSLFTWQPRGGVARVAAPAGGTVDSSAFVTSQTSYRSLDGTEVGLFLVHRRDVAPDAGTPCILTGYGGFAIAETPAWSPGIAAWCAQGGLYAIAGLRGGLEHGEAWHVAGMRANKQRVFDDFAAAADHLVAAGLTSRARLAIRGGSNGGLLVGATLVQRPDLCEAVVCQVPLLDMIRFPRFLIARLWTGEYGDPDLAEEFAWLWGYSPYHQVVDGRCYPSVLLTTADGEGRVHPSHARKMAAALQHASSCQHERPVLLRIDGRAGHGAGKPASMQADELADILAFCEWRLGEP
jgi:prolyl oligopeptidase